MRDDPARLAFEIRDHVLVAHVENTARRQHAPPMLHQLLISAVITAEFGQVIGMVLLGGEQLGEARDAGIDRVAQCVDDARIRQRQMDEPGEIIVGRHLVGDARGRGRELADFGEVVLADLAQRARVERGHEFGIGDGLAVRPAHLVDHVVERLQLARAKHIGVACQNLLHQRGARARHAQDENRRG